MIGHVDMSLKNKMGKKKRTERDYSRKLLLRSCCYPFPKILHHSVCSRGNDIQRNNSKQPCSYTYWNTLQTSSTRQRDHHFKFERISEGKNVFFNTKKEWPWVENGEPCFWDLTLSLAVVVLTSLLASLGLCFFIGEIPDTYCQSFSVTALHITLEKFVWILGFHFGSPQLADWVHDPGIHIFGRAVLVMWCVVNWRATDLTPASLFLIQNAQHWASLPASLLYPLSGEEGGSLSHNWSQPDENISLFVGDPVGRC